MGLDLGVLGFVLFAGSIASLYFAQQLLRLRDEMVKLTTTIEESTHLKEQLAQVKRDLKNPSTELQDFMADIRVHGCGVVRIDPDTLIVRSPRAREEG